MTPESQRITIAEACGWTEIHDFSPSGSEREEKLLGGNAPGGYAPTMPWLPDYLNDLNAIHAAEKTLNEIESAEYVGHLERICFEERNGITWEDHKNGIGWSHDEHVFATAAQRAEAFLRTKGLWREQPQAVAYQPGSE